MFHPTYFQWEPTLLEETLFYFSPIEWLLISTLLILPPSKSSEKLPNLPHNLSKISNQLFEFSFNQPNRVKVERIGNPFLVIFKLKHHWHMVIIFCINNPRATLSAMSPFWTPLLKIYKWCNITYGLKSWWGAQGQGPTIDLPFIIEN